MRRVLPAFVVAALLGWPAVIAAQDAPPDEWFSPDQLDNLLAPVALYPDPLLAQVLVAATFPDQIDGAARFVRDDANPDDIDGQAWDVSVKAVAHYPEVLDMMADKLDWTTALGQAYVNQSTDVMAAVQRLRAQAQAAGNLVSTPEMEVVDSGGEIELWPAQPQYIYVPEYDPAVVFFSRVPLFFHVRFFIGPWLNLDCDWRGHRLYYHGWDVDHGWIGRSRGFIHVTNVYVNDGFRNVVVNREVVQRHLNYAALNRYDDVHRQTTFARARTVSQEQPRPQAEQFGATVQNKIINRNIDTSDPRLEEYRGHVPKAPGQVQAAKTPAFTPSAGAFAPHIASERGQASRARVSPPPPPPPPPARGGKERR